MKMSEKIELVLTDLSLANILYAVCNDWVLLLLLDNNTVSSLKMFPSRKES